MRTLSHIIFGFFVSVILYIYSIPLLNIALFFIASFFIIDLDHVPRFVIKEKNLNPLKFLEWSYSRKEKWDKLTNLEKKRYKKPLYIFHSIETILLLLLLSLWVQQTVYIVYGFLFHLSCDLLYNIRYNEEKFNKISFIWTIITNKKRVTFS